MYAVIMAGGEGARFWPVSRQNRPKPFLSILGAEPLIVRTMARLQGFIPKEQILVLVNRKHQEVARRLLADLPEENLILEPRIRDTAPCVGLAGRVAEGMSPPRRRLCAERPRRLVHNWHPADISCDGVRLHPARRGNPRGGRQACSRGPEFP